VERGGGRRSLPRGVTGAVPRGGFCDDGRYWLLGHAECGACGPLFAVIECGAAGTRALPALRLVGRLNPFLTLLFVLSVVHSVASTSPPAAQHCGISVSLHCMLSLALYGLKDGGGHPPIADGGPCCSAVKLDSSP
jgi:hypothetical protein